MKHDPLFDDSNDTVKNAIQYNRSEEPIVISKPTSDKLLMLDHPADAMALYWFYYYSAKWKRSDTIYANNQYVITGLKWTNGRLSRAKRDLVRLNLVETVRLWDKHTKKLGKPLIKINFIWWDKEQVHSHAPDSVYPQISYDIRKRGIKGSTLIRETRNTNRVLQNKTFDPSDLPAHLGKYPLVAKAWHSFVQSRKESHHPITPTAYKLLIKKMIMYEPDDITAALNKSAEFGWRGVFFNDVSNFHGNPSLRKRSNTPDQDKDWTR